ncbi:ATP-grasp domain-containing protein [Sporosarcina sp.]|uniref:ATP-grasp domain-containing protein n=1 Tax=Sporosarcina sp. TaxID=49982 RepID=UPI002608B69F|nr:ATP-grasp domain-containing protein [Sporosarcina sp.]
MIKNILFVNLRGQSVERLKPVYTAKSMGLQVILLTDSIPENDLGLFEDIIIRDTYNQFETVEFFKKYNTTKTISGIITWSDKDVELVAKLGKALDLPTISIQSSTLVRNKYEMRLAMNKIEGLCPQFRSVKNLDDFKTAVGELGYGGILKPVGASGSKAIIQVDDNNTLENTFKNMLELTSPRDDKVYTYYPYEYIYEEFIDGPEVTVDGIVQNNHVYIAGVTDKFITNKHSLEYAAFFPSKKDSKTIEEIKMKTELAVKSLGINDAAFHLECRVSSKGVMILECAGRAGGGFVSSHLIELASNKSFHEQVIRVSLGLPVEWEEYDKISLKYAGSYFVYPNKRGSLKEISGFKNAIEIQGIEYVIPNVEIGDFIDIPPENVSTILASLIATNSSYEELINNLETSVGKLSFTVQ